MQFLRFLAVGLLAGWIMGRATRGEGFGLLGNLLVGSIGSFIGWFVFGFLNIADTNWIGSLVAAVVGAVVFFVVVGLFKPRKKKLKEESE